MFVGDLLARMIDAVGINQVHQHDDVLLKRRVMGRSMLIRAGNLFLKHSCSRIQMFVSTHDWQLREYTSYQTLYGGGCQIVGRDAVQINAFNGKSLKTYLEEQRLTDVMMVAAAHELQRGHLLGFTHGDPHLANILYDGERAGLIDFETEHDSTLSFIERRADDLLVVLLDLIGRERTNQWITLGRSFAAAYHDDYVLMALASRLAVPTRFLEKVLWKTRTSHINTQTLSARLSVLQAIVRGV